MSVVCGTDFSENAAEAVRVASALAARYREPLVLVHALDEHALLKRGDPAGVSLVHSAQELLHHQAEAVRQRGVGVQEEVLTGTPDETILLCADRVGARLVVVSALGYRSAAAGWRLGSVPERVAQATRIPVLVVRGAAAFEAWGRNERPLRILVAANFSVNSDAAIRWVADLRSCGPCTVIVMHLYSPAVEWARLGIHYPTDVARAQAAVKEALTRELAARLGELPGQGPIEFRIRPQVGDVVDHIVQCAREAEVDLVVTGMHQRRGVRRVWHGSVSQSVMQYACAAVTCVPVAPEPERGSCVIPGMQRVLVPTDLSELGDRAVPYAYALAGDGGVIHLLHVVEPYTVPNPLYAHYTPGRAPTPVEREKQIEDLARRLRGLVPERASERGVETIVHVLAGDEDVAQRICSTAERLGVDAICLSSHGRSGVSKLLAGSVAQAVMERSHRPLLVIRPPRAD